MTLKKTLYYFLLIIAIIVILIYIRIASDGSSVGNCTLYSINDIENTDFTKHKTVTLSANIFYDNDFFKTIIQGDNYRDAWSAKVELPILYLDTLFGGLSIVKEGGGKQTQSLRLRDEKGTLYTLRSINKNPEKLVPEFAKTLGIENVVTDGISAQNPYAAPVVAELSDYVNVLHTNPKPVFVPKQEVLGSYNETYGNRIYYLEYEPEGPVNWTQYSTDMELLDTDDLQELKLKLKDSLVIDKNALVRARLFDIIIGDWDRHAKQWGWVIVKSEAKYFARPIPADRDNAFFIIDGLIPSIVSNKNITPKLRPFEKEIDYMDGLIYDFDIYFLNNTPKSVFIEEANYIKGMLTDEAIEKALRYWNDELYNLYASDIAAKIKARRDNLVPISIKFKDVLDSKPLLDTPLVGSEDEELPPKKLACFEC